MANSDFPTASISSPSPWRWWVCTLLFLASVLNYMDRVALNQTAYRIKIAFSLSNEDYSMLESGFSVAFAFGTLLTGWLVDRTSVRWVYPIAVLGWSAAGFLTGYANSFFMLLVFRIMLGLFEAANWPCGVRTVRQVMPPQERSLGNSLFQSGTAIGAIITPLIVLVCIQWADPGEPNRNATLAATGGIGVGATGLPPDSWQVPFRIIGVIGILWVFLWVFALPSRALTPLDHAKTQSDSQPFWRLFQDRRYWILVTVIIGVNTAWHTFRVWQPLFLQRQHGYSEAEMSWFTTWFYLCSDVGSWTVGLLTLWLTQRGYRIISARLLMFAMCIIFMMSSLMLPFLDRGNSMLAVLLLFGFGSLGLFPTYFALSQDLSAQHQGKVTGSLGFINAIYLAFMFRIQGYLMDQWGEYETILSWVWVAPMISLVMLLLFWRDSNDSNGNKA